MAQPPKPLFVFFGIEGGATCCHVVEDRMFVGSQMGRVEMYGMATKIREETVYVDTEQRRIQSIDSTSSNDVFIHIRAHAIIRLHRKHQADTWTLVDTITTDHVGFCNSLLVASHPQRLHLLAVSSDEQRIPFLCWTDVSDGLEKSNQSRSDSCKIGDSVADTMPMCMSRGYSKEGEEQEVLVGMEDGRMAVFKEKERGFECEEMIKFGKEPIFSVASCSKWVAAGCARAPIFLMARQDPGSIREVHYPPDSAGCSSITFSPNEKQLLAGFSDGSIRVFSCQRLTILLALTSTHSASITSLIWRHPDDGEVVIATSSDSTVSLWKLR